MQANLLRYERLTIDSPRDELETRIARLRALALTLDDPEAAARLTNFILTLEVQLLDTPETHRP